jgi:hypothetical protein
VQALKRRRALGELLRLARLQREDDHPYPPAELFAVVPGEAQPRGLGGEREGTGRIGEEGDLERHGSGTYLSGSTGERATLAEPAVLLHSAFHLC